MQMIKTIVLGFFMSALLVILIGPKKARADDCSAARRDFYYGLRDWPKQCGREPNADWLAILKSDCIKTTQRINSARKAGADFGSGWNANWGDFAQETCEILEMGGEF